VPGRRPKNNKRNKKTEKKTVAQHFRVALTSAFVAMLPLSDYYYPTLFLVFKLLAKIRLLFGQARFGPWHRSILRPQQVAHRTLVSQDNSTRMKMP